MHVGQRGQLSHRVFFKLTVGAWAAQVTNVLAVGPVPAGLAIDGKTLRGSRQPTVPAVHLLGALGHDLGLVEAQSVIDPATGETAALPALLAELVLEGRVVTLDAAFTERPVAEATLAKRGPM